MRLLRLSLSARYWWAFGLSLLFSLSWHVAVIFSFDSGLATDLFANKPVYGFVYPAFFSAAAGLFVGVVDLHWIRRFHSAGIWRKATSALFASVLLLISVVLVHQDIWVRDAVPEQVRPVRVDSLSVETKGLFKSEYVAPLKVANVLRSMYAEAREGHEETPAEVWKSLDSQEKYKTYKILKSDYLNATRPLKYGFSERANAVALVMAFLYFYALCLFAAVVWYVGLLYYAWRFDETASKRRLDPRLLVVFGMLGFWMPAQLYTDWWQTRFLKNHPLSTPAALFIAAIVLTVLVVFTSPANGPAFRDRLKALGPLGMALLAALYSQVANDAKPFPTYHSLMSQGVIYVSVIMVIVCASLAVIGFGALRVDDGATCPPTTGPPGGAESATCFYVGGQPGLMGDVRMP